MGSAGKTAFVALIVLAAITGIVMYYLFEEFTIPKPGIINSVDRTNLTATSSNEAGSTLEGNATETTTTTTSTEGGSSANAPVSGVTVTIPVGASIQGSPDYNPDTANVPVTDNIVWVNEDTAAHTATSGTGATDPDSGKVFDTSIINAGETSAAQELKGVKEGDEVPYYCAVHPYMTAKLMVTAASAGGATNATTEGNASSTGTSTTNATANATTAGTGGDAGSNTTSTSTPATTTTTTTTSAANAATLTIPVGAATPGNPAYEPVSLTVKKGDEINVVNKDTSPHTVTSGTGLEDPEAGKMFDTSIINAGASGKVVTANLEAAEYNYHCAVHPFMTGKIIVQ